MKVGGNTNKVRLAEAGRGLFQIETIISSEIVYSRYCVSRSSTQWIMIENP